MAKKITKCCGANGLICDQCGDCPAPRYLPSPSTMRALDFWQIAPEDGHWAGTDVWRRPQPNGGYLQVVRGIETGIVVITDNHKLDTTTMKKGNKQTVWVKEPYHSAPLIDKAQFQALIELATI